MKEISGTNGAWYCGLLFELLGKRTNEYSDERLWQMAKEESVKQMRFPYATAMPCGESLRFAGPDEIKNLLIQDVDCPCGNPLHKLIAFRDLRE